MLAYEPDFVVVYFGWNDHWLAQGGIEDSAQYTLVRGSRVRALLTLTAIRFGAERKFRVPLAAFARNLEALAARARAVGAIPVFVTAPSGFEQGRMPPWAAGFFGKYYKMTAAEVGAIPAVHEAYAAEVRRVAAASGALLVDALAIFQQTSGAAPALLRRDRIHLTDHGHGRLAAALADTLAAALRATRQ